MTESEIIYKLHAKMFSNSIFMIPNTYFFGNFESDLVRMTKSNYLIEYEVKRTTSDLRADLKKRKHVRYENYFRRRHYVDSKNAPKEFYFAVTKKVNWQSVKLPEYAGIIEVTINYVWIRKKARPLHKEKYDDERNYLHVRNRLYSALWNKCWMALKKEKK